MYTKPSPRIRKRIADTRTQQKTDRNNPVGFLLFAIFTEKRQEEARAMFREGEAVTLVGSGFFVP